MVRLQVPIKVCYVDGQSSGGDDAKHNAIDFAPDGCPSTTRVHLLYRPGHYDLLYPKSL